MNRKLTLTIQFALMALAAITILTAGSKASAALPTSSVTLQAGQQQPAGGGAAPLAPVGSAITYQGRLKDGVNPANGQYDLTFKLYDAATGGAQVGNTVTILNKTITEGLFTVQFDFGASAYSSEARWLEIAVRPAGGGSYTTLSPRQPLTAVPYAMSLATGSTGAVISGTLPGPALIVTNTSGIGVYGAGNTSNGSGVYGVGNVGVEGYSSSNIGVYGASSYIGVFGTTTNGTGVRGTSTGGYGVFGISTNNSAIYGTSTNSTGVRGEAVSQHGGLFTNSSTTGFAALQGIASGTPGYGIYGEGNSVGIWGSTFNGTGVRGATTGGYGVHGYSVGNGTGVRGESSGGSGVYGLSTNDNGYGVFGENTTLTGYGVLGVNNANSTFARGVVGSSQNGQGVRGASTNGFGVYGMAPTNGVGVRGDGYIAGVAGQGTLWAGIFYGDIRVDGNCSGCLGPDKIDHPSDPKNKYLQHSVVESSEMLDIYSGNVTTDAKGYATVVLPDWFESLNKDFRYQLTVVGQFAQAIISSEIKNNRFVITTDKPSVKVSWQVIGTRNDPYSRAHTPEIEVEKGSQEKGKYLHPIEWGQPESNGIKYDAREQETSKP